MTALNFKINNRLQIIDNNGEVYSSDIQDIRRQFIAISIPIKESTYLPLRKNDTVDILYHDSNCIYSFSTEVTERTSSNIPIIWLKLPKEYKKIQRRKFVRVQVLYESKMVTVDREFKATSENIESVELKKCCILDLSGGGMKIRTDFEIEKGNIVAVILPMKNKNVIIKGEVKRIGNKEKFREYGLGFIDMSMREQDEIVRYVFTVMRKQMRKGLKEE